MVKQRLLCLIHLYIISPNSLRLAAVFGKILMLLSYPQDFCYIITNPFFDQIGHVRYINILTWLRGFQVKPLYLVLFSLYLSLFWELRDKGNLKKLQF